MNDALTLIIGTGDTCNLPVDDPYASARHAAISRRPNGSYWIEDLGSTNGTKVLRGSGLGIKIYGPFLLQRGDIIVVGRTQIPWSPPS